MAPASFVVDRALHFHRPYRSQIVCSHQHDITQCTSVTHIKQSNRRLYGTVSGRSIRQTQFMVKPRQIRLREHPVTGDTLKARKGTVVRLIIPGIPCDIVERCGTNDRWNYLLTGTIPCVLNGTRDPCVEEKPLSLQDNTS
jgi:hypothetical protein